MRRGRVRAGWKVVSIWPADGWVGVYAPDEGDTEFRSPLCGWAVVESADGLRQEIVGLDASERVKYADAWPNFVRYEHA